MYDWVRENVYDQSQKRTGRSTSLVVYLFIHLFNLLDLNNYRNIAHFNANYKYNEKQCLLYL